MIARALCLLAAAFVALSLASPPARALDTAARYALVMDAETGAILLEKNADQPIPPASQSKLMTIYMVFDALKRGALSLDDTFPVSERAWKMGGSRMFAEVDERISIRDLLRGVIVQSGNDACVVLAEGLAGSEEAFAEQMNARAAELGLVDSTFRNATGWPAAGHRMSARDLARLSRALIDEFPEYYPIFGETEFTWNNITQQNRNPLLYQNIGADGLKTGHTEEAGYSLTASAVQNGRRLIVVLGGLESSRQRSQEALRLMQWGFRAFENIKLLKSGQVVDDAKVWIGAADTVPLVLAEDLTITLSREARKDMKVVLVYSEPAPAPIHEGQPMGVIRIDAPGVEPIERPLIAGASVAQAGLLGKAKGAALYLLSAAFPG